MGILRVGLLSSEPPENARCSQSSLPTWCKLDRKQSIVSSSQFNGGVNLQMYDDRDSEYQSIVSGDSDTCRLKRGLTFADRLSDHVTDHRFQVSPLASVSSTEVVNALTSRSPQPSQKCFGIKHTSVQARLLHIGAKSAAILPCDEPLSIVYDHGMEANFLSPALAGIPARSRRFAWSFGQLNPSKRRSSQCVTKR